MVYTNCPNCGVQLKLADSVNAGSMVRCPSCKQVFHPVVSHQLAQANRHAYNKYFGLGIAGSVLLAVGLLVFMMANKRPNDFGSTHLTAPSINSANQQANHVPQWIRANYRGLVDLNQLTQCGQTIGSVIAGGLTKSSNKGQLQPFLDQFSRLLLQTLETARGGPNDTPRTSVVDELSSDSPKPAWAALLRGGRIVVTDDGNGTASVFALGDSAKQAYNSSYSVVRHILAGLLPADGQPLKVRAFAYQNDYTSCELKLCLDPFEIVATDFPPASGKTPLDLDSLRDFFSQGTELAGGSIDERGQLILVGRKGAKQSLASEPVELADLAVAYRAVFHAGDNQAFVSLDPNRNPTLVNVNFGGFLEDSRIGSVVLEADKRFKTITSGLDPTSFVDRRNDIRAYIPDFASVSERDLALPQEGSKGWQGTRFWYYPDSVEIEASLDYRQGAIARAQFTADAERSRDDFNSSDEFEQAKKSRLSPSIQMNIKDLNENYSQYAAIFPELRELSAVARLMGLCIWLQKANPAQLDMDDLLTVALPTIQTPRQKRQLVSVSKIAWDKSHLLNLSEAQSRSGVWYLTPVLDETVSEAFPTDAILASYLADVNGAAESQSQKYLNQAEFFRQLHGNEKASEIITNERCLQAFAAATSDTIKAPIPPDTIELNARLDVEKAELQRLKAKVQEVSAIMDRSSTDVYNAYVDMHNHLIEQVRMATYKYNADVDVANSKSTEEFHICRISGGISLEPENFKVRKSSTSPLLDQTKRVAGMKEASKVFQGEEWVRSKPSNAAQSKRAVQLRRPWIAGEQRQTANARLTSASAGNAEYYWRSAGITSGSWEDQTIHANASTERYYDATSRTLQIAEFEEGKLKTCVVGKYDGQNLIVFEKSPRHDISSPQQPPSWWH